MGLNLCIANRDGGTVVPSTWFRIGAESRLGWSEHTIHVVSSAYKLVICSEALKYFSMITYFQAHESLFVFVITERCATCEMDASASPRKP
jgi:hypothetical protein